MSPRLSRPALVLAALVPPLCFLPLAGRGGSWRTSRLSRWAEPEDYEAGEASEEPSERWWSQEAASVVEKLQVEETQDALTKLRRKMTLEEQAFDQEIEDVVIAGKRALLKLRMQRAVEMPGMKTHMFKKIRKQIARALTLRRQREIARGITAEQSRRMRRRRRLELKVQYEDAYGGERQGPKSRRWRRRMGRIV